MIMLDRLPRELVDEVIFALVAKRKQFRSARLRFVCRYWDVVVKQALCSLFMNGHRGRGMSQPWIGQIVQFAALNPSRGSDQARIIRQAAEQIVAHRVANDAKVSG